MSLGRRVPNRSWSAGQSGLEFQIEGKHPDGANDLKCRGNPANENQKDNNEPLSKTKKKMVIES